MIAPATYGSILDHAGRAWDAAFRLDDLRGDTAASEWTARRVREMLRSGEADDPRQVAALADALEARLGLGRERERDQGAG